MKVSCDGRFAGPCRIYSYIRRWDDDAPILSISFAAFSVDIPLAKHYRNFCNALKNPTKEGEYWSCAPGWSVKLIEDDQVLLTCAGIEITMSRKAANFLAWDILPEGKNPYVT